MNDSIPSTHFSSKSQFTTFISKKMHQSNSFHGEKNQQPQKDASGSSLRSVHTKRSNINLFLVCVFFTSSLILFLDACHPPSEAWVLSNLERTRLWDWTAAAIVVVFTILQAVLYYLPIGRVAEGKMGCHDKRLKYSLNGLHAFVVSAVLLMGLWHCGMVRGSSVSSRVLPLVSAGLAMSTLLSLWLYLRPGSAHYSQQPYSGNTGSFLQEFALGKEIDPRVGRIDMKQFAMVRIGFIGWAMMDLSYVLTAIETNGSLSLSFLLVVTFQLIYILDFLIDEDSVLPTKEFTEESVGFLMILGEYIWIPIFSSLPIYFLLHRPNHIDFLSAIPILLLFGIGFLFYYLSNEQKSGFRKNPNNPAYAHLKVIESPSGENLMVSGWFGWVRHPNYLGDILMMFAWCLPCGFTSLVPYLPVIQCINLLRQRANEIEASCQEKHGEAWHEYCRRVPYKVLPYIY
ncbi:delta(14)-sterol reductase TM7SF2 isoform X1 [Electrophorus electricus]|uniref:delta(14)-sterol reductase TM7SF2 isoform X1 n=1 Tax=Electrophorus electricus TaxID=8005 RepID=UPI0015D0A139|nr:delta(14)-sterol reductase TM7SF2 isoform X1 [Electrophorus electricus]XP_026886932.2 delta(14)-sterol reductase TM7SF2 isoform X1 [Electrophorus electricus]